MKHPTLRISLATFALVCTAGAAWAQMPAPAPSTGMEAPKALPAPVAPMPGMAPKMAAMPKETRGAMGLPFEHIEGRIAYAKAELKITDAQSAAWNTFADTMRADASTMKTMHDDDAKAETPTTLPDRIAARHKALSVRLAMMLRSDANIQTLYGTLTAEQREAFDQMMPEVMPMM